MKFSNVVPILYSRDVSVSIGYFLEKLQFQDSWEWDSPSTFGGVSRDGVEVFFCKEYQGNPATWIAIYVDNVDEYFELIKEKGAKIISTPESKEWNMREMLVQCPDGHVIRFGHRTDND